MSLMFRVTLLVVSVVSFVSLWTEVVLAAPTQANKVVVRADQIEKKIEQTDPVLDTEVYVSRSRSLNDYQDGTRKDSVDYLVVPTLKTSFGSVKVKIAYSQDLRDEDKLASDWSDLPVTFSLTPNKWRWSPPYIITITPFATALAPISQKSIVRDQLQTALSAGVSFAIIPDSIKPLQNGAWSLALGVNAGRIIHAYSTDINGQVLNKYLSNQTLNMAYTYNKISFSVEFINKSRWTYEGNVKSTFEHTEELGYALTDYFNLAVGHSNSGSTMKANGADSNVELINENDSTVYAQIGLSF